MLLEELRVSWLVVMLALLLAVASSAALGLLIGIPSSNGRGISGGDVHRIRAQFTPARHKKET